MKWQQLAEQILNRNTGKDIAVVKKEIVEAGPMHKFFHVAMGWDLLHVLVCLKVVSYIDTRINAGLLPKTYS